MRLHGGFLSNTWKLTYSFELDSVIDRKADQSLEKFRYAFFTSLLQRITEFLE